MTQFKGIHINLKKADTKEFRETLTRGKAYDDLTAVVGSWTGEDEFLGIVHAIESRSTKDNKPLASVHRGEEIDQDSPSCTPPKRDNPEPPGLDAPLIPANGRIMTPAAISGHDSLTPTPGGGICLPVM